MSNGSIELPPPTPLLSDYITIGYQCVFIAVGVPINVHALWKLALLSHRGPPQQQRPNGNTPARSMSRFVTLKLHLTISDLMTLLFYSVTEAVWTATYTWEGGDLLCKLVHFLKLLSFSAHANVVVAIALERVFAVRQMRTVTNGHSERQRLNFMLYLSWLLAVAFCSPQLLVWRVGSPFTDAPEWRQCATIWDLDRRNSSGRYATEAAYNIAHLLVLSWIPAMTIGCSYTFIVVSLIRSAHEQRQKMQSYQRKRSLLQTSAARGTNQDRRLELRKERAEVAIGVAGEAANDNTENSIPSTKPHPVIMDADSENDVAGLVEESSNRVSSVNGGSLPPIPPTFARNSTCNDVEQTTAAATVRFSNSLEPPATATSQIQRRHCLCSCLCLSSSGSYLHLAAVARKKSLRRQRPMSTRSSWWRQIRSRTLRQTLLIVAAYILLWTPYNVLVVLLDLRLLSDPDNLGVDANLNSIYSLIILNSVIDPLLYRLG